MTDITPILDLINRVIRLGGELVPIALRAYAALKAESGLTDEELIARARALNEADAAKLEALIAETDAAPHATNPPIVIGDPNDPTS